MHVLLNVHSLVDKKQCVLCASKYKYSVERYESNFNGSLSIIQNTTPHVSIPKFKKDLKIYQILKFLIPIIVDRQQLLSISVSKQC